MNRLLLGAALLASCRGSSCARATPDEKTEEAPGRVAQAPPKLVDYPHHPEGCDYVMQPPHAGSLQVRRHAELYGPHPEVRNLHLTYVGDPSNSLVVQWTTDESTFASTVRLQPVGGAEMPAFEGYSFPLPGVRGRRQHEVHLCPLSPSTRYRYVAGGARVAAAQHGFTTPPASAGDVRAGVAGDSRTNPQEWGRVSRALLAMRPDVLLFTGDAVANGASMALWDEFFSEGAELLAEVPGVWADGNHEGRATLYYDQFALPANDDRDYHEHWYALTYGPLRVITLNDTTVPAVDIAGAETAFLRGALARVDRARTPWVVTMHHQPTHTDAIGHAPDSVTRASWGPLFDQYHVDVDLSGHVHNYESSEPMSAGRVVDPTHGTRYLVFGGAGAPLYAFHAQEPWVHHRESTHGFGILSANATTLRWEAYRDDGSLIEAVDLGRR